MCSKDPLLLAAISLAAGILIAPVLPAAGDLGVALAAFGTAAAISRYRRWYMLGVCLFAGALTEAQVQARFEGGKI